MKNAAIRFAALVALHTLFFEISHAAEPGRPRLNEEYSNQEKIYQTEDENLSAGYVVDRSLSNYMRALPAAFDPALANLGETDRWLDIGAGKGFAILDYYGPNYDLRHVDGKRRSGKRAMAVAVSIENRKTLDWRMAAARLDPGQIKYLSGRRLREYSAVELGQFQLITDVYGAFSYTRDLSLFMKKALSLLALDGNFYTLLQDVRSEAGTNEPLHADSPFSTGIENTDGSEVTVCSWLKSMTCVKVTCELKPWKSEVYSIRKVCNDIRIPALVIVDFAAGTPPGRRFQLKNE